MRKSRKPAGPRASGDAPSLGRLSRPLSLKTQVEQLLRQAITEGRFAGGQLPTEVELAEQLGVSRETVRRAADVLQGEGLLVKIRRKGTFTQPPRVTLPAQTTDATLLGYLQADYPAAQGQEEAVTRAASGLMLQGALAEAGRAGFELVVRHAPHTQMGPAFQQLIQNAPLRGVIFASCGEEKLLRRVLGLGLPTVLLDHDLPLPHLHSIRDDSLESARQAVQYLASLGHRRIAFAHWHQADLNPWRLRGYRQGLRDANLPRRRCWEILTELTESGARQVVERLLVLEPRPSAVYCFNNTLARLVHEELRRQDVRVPRDLSVMGAGGEEVPGLTCHQVDWYQMGLTAVQTLLRALADPNRHAPERHLSPHTLRIGQTTACRAEGDREGVEGGLHRQSSSGMSTQSLRTKGASADETAGRKGKSRARAAASRGAPNSDTSNASTYCTSRPCSGP
jgi:DNA-binding LacI/PurR family transcriptional regulator